MQQGNYEVTQNEAAGSLIQPQQPSSILSLTGHACTWRAWNHLDPSPQALLSTTLRRTVLFHILSTCVSRALAAFGGSPLSQEAPDARAGEGSGTRGQSPDLPAGLQLLPFPLQHISSRPGLVDHRDFWKRAEQERKGRKACPLGCRAYKNKFL